MPGPFMKVDSNVDEIRERLQALAHRTSHLKPTLGVLGEHLQRTTRDRFRTSTAPNGERWPDYANDYYRAYKAKKGRSPLLLVFSGRLENSIIHKEDDHQLLVGTNVEADNGFPYPAAHQFGWGSNPVRAFLGVSEKDTEYALSLLERAIMRAE